jgi:hypothetical protein
MCNLGSNPRIEKNVIQENEASLGGGICIIGSTPVVMENRIIMNQADQYGGGIFGNDKANAVICQNHFQGNSAGVSGGGIYLVMSSPGISNNVFIDNRASEAGGAIRCFRTSSPRISNNSFQSNSANYGGGIACYFLSNPVITSNIVTYSFNYGIVCQGKSTPQISYNDMWNNKLGNYYGCSGGTGAISVDPRFGRSYTYDLMLCAGSMCINTGNPDPQFNDIDKTRNDMGAYGGPAGKVAVHVPSAVSTIGAALELAPEGAVVLVSPGNYVESLFFKGRAVCLLSEAGWDSTAIDANNTGAVLNFVSFEKHSTIVEGFTLTGGHGNPDHESGGAIYCRQGDPVIRGNRIINNWAYLYGGGLYAWDCEPQIYGNLIVGNEGRYGGGLYFRFSKGAVIEGNTLVKNKATLQGGGIFTYAGNIYVKNNIITHSVDGEGFYTVGKYNILQHNLVWGNRDPDYTGCEPGEWDLQQDPKYRNYGAGDYTLSYDSPAIDSGDPASPGVFPGGRVSDIGYSELLYSKSPYVTVKLIPPQNADASNMPALEFQSVITNVSRDTKTFDYWIDMVAPDTTMTTEIKLGLKLEPGLTDTLTHNYPLRRGLYRFTGRTGKFREQFESSDQFTVEY